MIFNRLILSPLAALALLLSGALFAQENRFRAENLSPAVLLPAEQLPANQFGQGPSPLMNSGPAADSQDSSGGGKFKYVLMSLVLPGSGEWAMGRKTLGKVFIGVDALFWIGYFSSKHYVNILQSDMEAYAALHAGVNSAGKDGQYWIDVGSYPSIYQFNEAKLRQRDLAATYPEGAGYDWVWDSEENRVKYVEKRFQRLDWKRRTDVLIGALILNRLVSAIDVIRLIKKSNSAKPERQSYLNLNYLGNPHQGDALEVRLTWSF